MKEKNQCSKTEVTCVTVGPFQENTFFLRPAGGDETIVIDPGDEAERLFQLVEEKEWKPVAVLTTHAHLDHIGAVEPFRQRYGIPYFLHEEDLFLLEGAADHALMFGVTPPKIPSVDRSLEDVDMLELAGLSIQTLHTPGHSPGSVCFRVDGRLFAGDLVFQGSIGRTDLPGGDYDTIARSLREHILTLPDDTVIHCGHGPDTRVGVERRTNPFLLQL